MCYPLCAGSVSEELISANLADHITPAAASSQSSHPASVSSAAAAPVTLATLATQSVIGSIAEGSRLNIKLTYFVSIDLMYGHLAENVSQILDLQMSLNAPGVVGDSTHPDL